MSALDFSVIYSLNVYNLTMIMNKNSNHIIFQTKKATNVIGVAKYSPTKTTGTSIWSTRDVWIKETASFHVICVPDHLRREIDYEYISYMCIRNIGLINVLSVARAFHRYGLNIYEQNQSYKVQNICFSLQVSSTIGNDSANLLKMSMSLVVIFVLVLRKRQRKKNI